MIYICVCVNLLVKQESWNSLVDQTLGLYLLHMTSDVIGRANQEQRYATTRTFCLSFSFLESICSSDTTLELKGTGNGPS